MRSAGWLWVLILATVVSLASALPRHHRGSLPSVDAAWSETPAAVAPVLFPFNLVVACARLATSALDRLP